MAAPRTAGRRGATMTLAEARATLKGAQRIKRMGGRLGPGERGAGREAIRQARQVVGGGGGGRGPRRGPAGGALGSVTGSG